MIVGHHRKTRGRAPQMRCPAGSPGLAPGGPIARRLHWGQVGPAL